MDQTKSETSVEEGELVTAKDGEQGILKNDELDIADNDTQANAEEDKPVIGENDTLASAEEDILIIGENDTPPNAEEDKPVIGGKVVPLITEDHELGIIEDDKLIIAESDEPSESMESKRPSAVDLQFTEPQDDKEEYLSEGEELHNFAAYKYEVLPPDSFEDLTVTPEQEPFHGETTFYVDDVEGGEYEYAMAEEEEEENEQKESSVSQMYTTLSPFFLKWSFGVKISTKFINLTKDNQFEVFYAASHYGVLYDYRRNTMRFLPGHNSAISSIAADATGRWLVSADDGEDNVIIIWDYEKQLPCWTLFDLFSGKGTRCVQISQDARFLTAVSSDSSQICKFFLWTYGRDQADGEIELGSNNGNVMSIHFNHVETTQFAITMETKIMYCQWVSEKKILESFLTGIKMRKKGKVGIFRETIFLDDNHTSVTSTNSGHMVVWSDTLKGDTKGTIQGSIMKRYTKTIKIHKSGITSLLLVDQIIVSSSEEGIISFHDQMLCLLYFVRKYQVEPIACVSCNLRGQNPDQIDPFSQNFDIQGKPGALSQHIQDLVDEWSNDILTGNRSSEDESTTSSEERIQKQAKSDKLTVPSDYTIDMKPFCTRDLMFLTWNGMLGYVSHQLRKVRYFLYGYDAMVISMDCNPNLPHIAMGNSVGRINLFDYRSKVRLVSSVVAETGITTLKYSPSGRYLTAGLTNGTALLLDPVLLLIRMKISIGRAEIIKFCFTSNERMFAFYDACNTVYLCKIAEEKRISRKCSFMGGYKAHYKPIRDILFDEEQDIDDKEIESRLYTIGEDRMMVEYDVKNAQPGVLKLKRIDRIEQTAIPQCFTMLPRFGQRVTLLVSNNEYKFKVLCRKTRITYKTTLGPTADTPPDFLRVLPGDEENPTKMIIATKRHIGLRLLPPTGNPYEGMGMVGHPLKITAVAISHDNNYVFTAGLNDMCVLAWKINPSSVKIAHQLGGTGLEPFTSLIEGGTNGFLYGEIEDFFYYSQIIHQGEHANIDRVVTKHLALCEIPDFVRSLGFFPTEYEIENIIRELKHLKYEETGEIMNEVSFDDCVKMYLNHRPVNGISLESINKALLSVADLGDPECIIIEKEELYKSLEQRGEPMSHEELVGYLCILLLPKDERDPVPAAMTLKYFADDVLGIDLSITEENVREITNPMDKRGT